MGLLALMLLHESRRAARTTADGRDRSAGRPGPHRSGTASRSPRARRWSSGRWRRAAFGPYTLQAAIAAVHAEAPTPRRPTGAQIVGAVRCVAAGRPVAGRGAQSRGRGGDARRPSGGPRADRRDPRARRADRLSPGPRGAGGPVPACRAGGDARASYERALALARQEPERRFLERRLAELPD